MVALSVIGQLCMRKLFFLILLMIALPIGAAPHKNLWPVWQVNNPLSNLTIPHTEWQTFLTKSTGINEEGINLVDYGNLQESDKKLLQRYLDRMSSIPVHTFNRNEQLAFWINLYNALTVKIISEYYPVTSINDINISPGLFSIGPWSAKTVAVNQINLSLDEIQNRIIGPIWNDPRTHYALNNGTIGAPNLSREVYQGKILAEQLNQAACTYVNSLRGIQVIDGELLASKIYEWFNEDFGGSEKSLLIHLMQFAKPELKRKLFHLQSIHNYTYNWHLNTKIMVVA